ncbi:hypothetical protein GJ629_12460 [Halapricum sp. CBA1109]|uniref:hypothetical protein n=1 Tax=Halapricum sp. CBA1109 TaxID=2668068 RepID=UPI0012F74426|nr:hypothetical protein [Halapricum sp. CBA1109]MUV90609.1 hypothetical protein [Halapricum sp. CBA1109]
MVQQVETRRELLAALGVGISVGLAGCGGDDSGDGEEDDDEDEPEETTASDDSMDDQSMDDGSDTGSDGGGDDSMDGGGDDSMDDGGDDSMDDGSDSGSDDGSTDDGSDDSADDGSDSGSDAEATGDVDGTVTNQLADGIEVVSHSGSVTEDMDGNETFELIVTVQNNGEETFEIIEHDFSATLYDSDGNQIGTSSGFGSFGGSPEPGEEVPVFLSGIDADPQAIASYEITLSCSGFDEGAYCPEG